MSDLFDLDALEVEAESDPGFSFTYKGETYTMPVAAAMPWQDQLALETATSVEALNLILGKEQFDRLSKQPMSSGRMAKLIEKWQAYQGVTLGE
jgi:hypothetical protein